MEQKPREKNLLRIKVLTLLIRFTNFPFTLAASSLGPPNEGSVGVLPHPTTSHQLRHLLGIVLMVVWDKLTAREESVL